MKILFSSHVFEPSVGGIESVAKILVEKFSAAGHSVHVITQTPGEEMIVGPVRVSRRPSLSKVINLLRWADLLFQNNISLRSLIPAVMLRKRVVIVHHTWIQDPQGRIRWRDRLKYSLLPYATNVAISEAVANRLNAPKLILANPYDDTLFRVVPGIARNKTIVFLGRLVSDKGVDILVRALKLLQQEGLVPDVTIIGDGPEEPSLRKLAADLGLKQQLNFAGAKSGQALVELLNQHRIMAVPSRWAEPFGLVALEGIACGCVVVGSARGGLKEAIGPCGVTFENGNEQALATALKELLTHPEKEEILRREASVHLQKFKSDAAAAAYLELIEKG